MLNYNKKYIENTDFKYLFKVLNKARDQYLNILIKKLSMTALLLILLLENETDINMLSGCCLLQKKHKSIIQRLRKIIFLIDLLEKF